MTLSDFAEAKDGMATIVGAGMDRVIAPNLPVLQRLGIAARITFTPSECDRPHQLHLVVRLGSTEIGQGGGEPLMITAPGPELPEGWPAGVILGVTLNIPIQEYGVYHVDLRVDGMPLHTSSFIVVGGLPGGVG